jgi:hypothetical protein
MVQLQTTQNRIPRAEISGSGAAHNLLLSCGGRDRRHFVKYQTAPV